jgi:SPOR domain
MGRISADTEGGSRPQCLNLVDVLTRHPANSLNCAVLSDKVPYYILDLLQQVPSVYLEGLGRFEAIFHPAVIDLPQARIKPPFVEPGFRDDLEDPNQTLEAYITYASGPDVGSPKEAIDEFVRKVYDRTTEGQTYLIDKFGTFSRSALGNIRFTPDWDAFNLSFSGLEVLDVKPAAPDYTYPSTPYVPPPAEIVSSSVAIEITPVTSQDLPLEKTEPTPIATPHIEPQKGSDRISIEESTSRLWWIILTSALVLIAVLCAYLAWDILSNRQKLNDLKQIYPDTITATRNNETIPPIEDSTAIVQEDQQEPQEVVPDPVPVETETPAAGTEPCYVVVGAFTDPVNITKMIERLTSLGYTAEEIKGRSLTRVAIRTSCDQDSLQQLLNEARSNINPEAWIY